MFPPLAVELAGFLGSVMAFLIFLPQALKTFRSRRLYQELKDTLSKGSQWFVVCNATIWGYYAIGSEAYWVGAPGLINLPLAVMTLFFLYRADYRLKTGVKQVITGQEPVEHSSIARQQ